MSAQRRRMTPPAGGLVQRIMAAAVTLALAVATLIPSGWMPAPAAAGVWALAWCGAGEGPDAPGAPGDPDADCAFALAPIATTAPEASAAPVPILALSRVARIEHRAPEITLRARGAWARGPPARRGEPDPTRGAPAGAAPVLCA